MDNCWNKTIEIADREQIKKIQSERLKETVNRIYQNVPYYRDRMHAAGVFPEDIKTVDDLVKLPFTTKQDLRDTYPFGMFTVPMSQIVRVHASSGTTGKQIVVGYTQNDIAVWQEVLARALTAAYCDNTSMVQVAYGYGLFTGGLGVHYGVERIGATVIPISGGNTHRQIQLMRDFGTTLLACTPSYALYIAESLEESGIKLSELKLKAGLFGAEPWTDNMRKEIECRLGIKAFDIYGLSEIIGPGVAFDCECQNGLHINEDHFIPEIINPDTGEPMPEGTQGELVFTTITKEGFPLIRYRTRDVSSVKLEKCECGRTLARMTKPCGRTDDMLIIRGVNVFPSQIESVLLEMGDTSPHYQLIVDRMGTLDTLEVQVEMSDVIFSDEIRELENIENNINRNIENTLGISCKVTLVEPKTIQRSEGKAKRVIDKRTL